jgi:hypothetical protein
LEDHLNVLKKNTIQPRMEPLSTWCLISPRPETYLPDCFLMF